LYLLDANYLISMQIHWSLAVIFMTEKRIQYYDSLNWDGTTYVDMLLQ
jgi:Ulp1 family protease